MCPLYLNDGYIIIVSLYFVTVKAVYKQFPWFKFEINSGYQIMYASFEFNLIKVFEVGQKFPLFQYLITQIKHRESDNHRNFHEVIDTYVKQKTLLVHEVPLTLLIQLRSVYSVHHMTPTTAAGKLT
jgi:hypothetical protein